MRIRISELQLIAVLISLFKNADQFLLDTEISPLSRCPLTVAHGRYLHVFRDHCFEFVLTNEKYWSDARHDCQEKGGDLIVIPDAATQYFVMTTLGNLGNSKHGIWLGLTDSRHELHWEWVNGEPLTGYTNWAHQQGGANPLHYTQDCAQIRTDDHGMWHDRECHLWPNKYSYICEFEMLPMPSTTTSTTIRTSTVEPTTKTSTTPTTTTSSTTMMKTTTTTTTTTPATPIETTSQVSSSQTTENVTSSVEELSNINTTVATNPNIIVTNAPSTLLSILSTKHSYSEISPNATNVIINTTESVQGATDIYSQKTTSSVEQTELKTVTPNSATDPTSETHSSTGSSSTTSLSFLTSRLPVPVSSPTTRHECTWVDCDIICPHGYSGLYVGSDGCVECGCL